MNLTLTPEQIGEAIETMRLSVRAGARRCSLDFCHPDSPSQLAALLTLRLWDGVWWTDVYEYGPDSKTCVRPFMSQHVADPSPAIEALHDWLCAQHAGARLAA